MRPKLSFSNPRNITYICLFSVLSVACVFVLDLLTLNYWLRSAIKVAVFMTCFFTCCKPNMETVFKPKSHKSIIISSILGLVGIAAAWGLFLLIQSYFDFSKVASGTANLDITKENYWYVTAYIAIINSFLEEVFFRGMCHIKLTENSNKIFANVFSALLFSIYHLTMLSNIMYVGLTILCLAALFGVGLLFNKVNEKTGNIYNSWIIHACANVAINSIGWTLL